MVRKLRSQRLNGLFPLSYMGVIPVSPPNFVIDNRPPNTNDSKNFYLGDIWLDYTTDTPPKAKDIWMLVSLVGNIATWVNFGAGTVEFLQGNTGGPVGPDGAGVIHTIGDTTIGLTVAGNPGTNTLTITTVNGQPLLQSLTGNSGGAVFPDVNENINVLGTGVITVVGNPGTHTLTITPSGAIASSFPTDSGTATPALGVLNILAQHATLGAGSSVLFSAPGPANTVQLNVTDANNNTIIGKSAGNLTLTSTNSTILGQNSGHALTTGSNSTIIGNNAGSSITTGANDILIGNNSGSNYTGAETNDIIIGNTGVLGESNTTRIGSTGVQTSAYMSGIYNQPFGGTNGVVFVDNTDKLGSSNFSALPWTPTLSFGGASVGITYLVQEGKYQAFGNLVFYSGGIILTNKGISVGLARMEGLPFASSGTATVYQGFMAIGFITLSVGNTYAWAQNEIGTTNLQPKQGGTGIIDSIMTDANFANNSALTITGFYFRA